jgi:hypothetical protein
MKDLRVSGKLRLWDSLTISIDDKNVTKKVSDWIDDDPMRIFTMLYGKVDKTSQRISLASDSFTKLKLKMAKHLLEEVATRRQVHLLKKTSK